MKVGTYTLRIQEILDSLPEGTDVYKFFKIDDYPIYDEAYRATLNDKILNHYMFQEIGRETVDNFVFALRTKLHEVMPFYNKLYALETKTIDPLVTVDIKTTGSGITEEESKSRATENSTSDTDSKSRQVNSVFPQQMLSGNTDYATSAVDSNSQTDVSADSVSEGEADNKATNSSESRTVGYQGSPAMLLQQYRATLMNVDMLVIAELEPLFMIVWDNLDNFTTTNGGYRYG